MRSIGGLFGRSAFGPLHEQVLKVLDCTRAVCELVRAHAEGDWERLLATAARIHELEHQADRIKLEIRGALSASLFSSVERGDILFLVKHIDELADLSEEAAKFLEVRRTELPKELSAGYLELGDKVCECADVLSQVTAQLARMEAEGTAGSRKDEVIRLIDKVHSIEHDADTLQNAFLKRLFSIEKKLDPLSIVMLLRISERLLGIAGQAANDADVIMRMVAKL